MPMLIVYTYVYKYSVGCCLLQNEVGTGIPCASVIAAVPRLNRNRFCINLIYSYYILFFSRFDTVKFP